MSLHMETPQLLSHWLTQLSVRSLCLITEGWLWGWVEDEDLCVLCVQTGFHSGGGKASGTAATPRLLLLLLTDVLTQPPPQEVLLSHHPGIIGEQAAS